MIRAARDAQRANYTLKAMIGPADCEDVPQTF